MPSVFDVLSRDHEEVKRMLEELAPGPTILTGASETQLALRKKMVEELIIEESKHEAVEEMYFWPAVRRVVADGDQLADAATEQEQLAKQALDQLDRLDASAPAFEPLLARFTEAGQEHIAFEEAAVWPRLSAVLSAQESDDLGAQIEQAKKTAPTRPHPATPAHPAVLKGAGPAIAAFDRLRDALSGRGRD